MDRVHVIRHKVLIEGLSSRQVAQEFGVSRNTVRKYLKESEPVFHRTMAKTAFVLNTVKPRIEALYEEWSDRTTTKQRITARRIYQQLIEEKYNVSYSTVRTYVREKNRLTKEVFIPLIHPVGEEAQIDFFEVSVELDGTRCKRWMFVLHMMYSGIDGVFLYERCDQVSFLDGHVRAFSALGGVPRRCVYDNLSAAVKRKMFPHRELTDRFKALVSHYVFEPCFARPYEGHDKGGVEARGKGIRLGQFVPIPRGSSLKEIEDQFILRLETEFKSKKDREGRKVFDKWVEEKKVLRPLPSSSFEPRLIRQVMVNRQALVTIDGGQYSVPSHWRCLDITAYIGAMDIRFICREEIVERKRVGPREKNIQYRDYIEELRHKPQAVRQVAPRLLKELGEPFCALWSMLDECYGGKEAGRVFAKILEAIVKHGEQQVSQSITRVFEGGHRHLLELGSLLREPLPADIDVPDPLKHYVIESATLADFDHLLCEVAL